MWLIFLSRGMELQARIASVVNWFPFAIPGDPFCSNLKNSFEQISSVTWPLGGLHLFMALCFAWKLRVPRRDLVRWCCSRDLLSPISIKVLETTVRSLEGSGGGCPLSTPRAH